MRPCRRNDQLHCCWGLSSGINTLLTFIDTDSDLGRKRNAHITKKADKKKLIGYGPLPVAIALRTTTARISTVESFGDRFGKSCIHFLILTRIIPQLTKQTLTKVYPAPCFLGRPSALVLDLALAVLPHQESVPRGPSQLLLLFQPRLPIPTMRSVLRLLPRCSSWVLLLQQ